MQKSLFLTSPMHGILLLVIMIISCGNPTQDNSSTDNSTVETVKIKQQRFSQDSAYSFIKRQTEFGYRIPGTPEHLACANWLYQKISSYTDTAYFPKGKTQTHDGKSIPVYNIIGSFNPKSKNRIVLAAHWDSRPMADQDQTRTNEPISGANDGASGVGVLLELARIFDSTQFDFGIDIIFFDAEDLGVSEVENSFCLGSQFWAKNLHTPGYKAKMGILLDMVGGRNAQFLWEANSNQWGNFLLAHVWTIAQELGYSDNFKMQGTSAVIDDHVYVYQGTGIPMIDIIDYNHTRGFPEQWHTHNDNLNNIYKPTLKAVGHTLENTLLNPPPSLFY